MASLGSSRLTWMGAHVNRLAVNTAWRDRLRTWVRRLGKTFGIVRSGWSLTSGDVIGSFGSKVVSDGADTHPLPRFGGRDLSRMRVLCERRRMGRASPEDRPDGHRDDPGGIRYRSSRKRCHLCRR